jgi:DNA-binding NarL/FixJ family response regulator
VRPSPHAGQFTPYAAQPHAVAQPVKSIDEAMTGPSSCTVVARTTRHASPAAEAVIHQPKVGLQVHDELVARGCGLPVLFLSGHGDIPMAVDALHKGVLDFVEKPFSDDTLVQRIERALALEAERHTAAGGRERVASGWPG